MNNLVNLLCGPVDDSATESEGDGNAREVTVAAAAPPAKAPKKEPRAKGVLKRKSVNHEGPVKNEFTPPPDHHPVVEVQQPKGRYWQCAVIFTLNINSLKLTTCIGISLRTSLVFDFWMKCCTLR